MSLLQQKLFEKISFHTLLGDEFWGPFLESFQTQKANFKSLQLTNKKGLLLETLHKCKLCLNAKPVEIKSSVHQALHGL